MTRDVDALGIIVLHILRPRETHEGHESFMAAGWADAFEVHKQ